MIEPLHIGDGVYAICEAHDEGTLWLRTGSHEEGACDNSIILEPPVIDALIKYIERMRGKEIVIQTHRTEAAFRLLDPSTDTLQVGDEVSYDIEPNEWYRFGVLECGQSFKPEAKYRRAIHVRSFTTSEALDILHAKAPRWSFSAGKQAWIHPGHTIQRTSDYTVSAHDPETRQCSNFYGETLQSAVDQCIAKLFPEPENNLE